VKKRKFVLITSLVVPKWKTSFQEMITRLTSRNFRGFDRHTVPLRPITILVGKNNAGKSTVVEVL
jgi:predicted ATPase